MRTTYLVCYDIADPGRLARVCRLMKEHGVHLQFSVFLCSLTWPDLGRLKEALARHLDESQDDVRIYPLPADEPLVALGQGDRVPEGASVHLS